MSKVRDDKKARKRKVQTARKRVQSASKKSLATKGGKKARKASKPTKATKPKAPRGKVVASKRKTPSVEPKKKAKPKRTVARKPSSHSLPPKKVKKSANQKTTHAATVARKRSAASVKGWATRRAREAAEALEKARRAAQRKKRTRTAMAFDAGRIAEPLERFLQAKETGAPHAVLKARHAEYYEVKSQVRDFWSYERYEAIMREVGESVALDFVQPYIDS